MEQSAINPSRRRPWLRLVATSDGTPPDSTLDRGGDAGQEDAPRKFSVMFALPEPVRGPWGQAFRGEFSLASILEIMEAYRKDGVRLRCLFLEDKLGDDLSSIQEAFSKVDEAQDSSWAAVHAVDPMLFAAGNDLMKAASALTVPDTFEPNPDQIIEGSVNAMGAVLRQGYDTSLVLMLLLSGPSLETVAGALEEIRRRRRESPDLVNSHQRFCCGAVVAMLEDELAIGGRFLRCMRGDIQGP